MDQYIAADGDLLLGDALDLPHLSLPLLPVPVADVSGPVSVTTHSVGKPILEPSLLPLDLSQEGPFDVDQTILGSEDTPRVLDSLPGCQYRITSYYATDRPDLKPVCGLNLHDPRFLEYVGVPESARLLSRAPDYWLHHMSRDQAISATLQLQRNAGLIMSNLQVLDQFVTSLNRMSSEVMRLAFGHEPYPSEAIQSVAPSLRVRRAAHYMAVMGLWRPLGSQGAPGPLPTSSCNACMMCADCFPDLRK